MIKAITVQPCPGVSLTLLHTPCFELTILMHRFYYYSIKELTKFMKIDHGHNVPLSVIIDKHWDRLKFHMREDTDGY